MSSANSTLGNFLKISLFSLIFILFLSSCVSSPKIPLDTKRQISLENSTSIFKIDYNHKYERDASLINYCIRQSLPELKAWGGLKYSVKVHVYATHNDLERAVGRHGYPWLRAWAKFQNIHIQTPSSWNGYRIEKRVCELVQHELTHVVMYQHVGDANNWYKKKIPLWFREGMASNVAKQGYRRMSKNAIQQYYRSPEFMGDPITDGDKLIKNNPKLVYSAAHWAFADLLETYGRQRIVLLIKLIGKGEKFRIAWEKTFGIKLLAFEKNWSEKMSTVGTGGG